MTTVLVWVGVLLIGGIGSVKGALLAALLGFLGGLALSKDAALLTGTAFVGSYTTFSTWMLESQRLGEERRALAEVANIVVSVVLGLAAALVGQWLAEQL